MSNDDVLSSDVNIDVNNNSLRDVRTRTFWRPRPSESADFVSASAGISEQASASAHVCEWGEGHEC